MCTLPNIVDFCPEFSAEVSIVIGCQDPVASRLDELNRGNPHVQKLDTLKTGKDTEDVVNANAPEVSFASSTSSSFSGSWEYFAIRNSSGRRLRFGCDCSADSHHFTLPKEYGVKKGHFHILVNDQPSWMMQIWSKTTVNYERLGRGSQTALHPEEPNTVGIQSLILAIYIIKSPRDSGWHQYCSDLPTCSQITNTPTQSSSSWSKYSDASRQEAPRSRVSVVHKLASPLHQVSGPSSNHELIYRTTGRHMIGKFYEKQDEAAAKERYSFLINVLKAERYLLPFIETMYLESFFVIVTEYCKSQSLEAVCEEEVELEPSQLMLIYAQLGGGALDWLEQHNIVHRNIRPDVILLHDTLRITPRLTGFSESVHLASARELPRMEYNPWMSASEAYHAPEMQAGQPYSNSVDIYSLSMVIQRVISNNSTLFATDAYLRNLITQGLTEDPKARLTPSKLRLAFEQTIGSLEADWPPFKQFSAEKEIALDFDCHDDNIFIASKSLQAVLTALRRSGNEAANLSDSRWAYRHRRKWINLKAATKYCFKYKLTELENLFTEQIVKYPDIDKRYFISFSVHFHIWYHAPSLMINISQILLMAEIDSLESLDDYIATQCLRVLGPWKGDYLDLLAFQQLSGKLEMLYGMRIGIPIKSNNSHLENRIKGIDGSRYCLLAIDQLHPHMVILRKCDQAINFSQLIGEPSAWECSNKAGHFVDLQRARQLCSSRNMQHSLATLDQLLSESLIVPRVESDLQDDEESITSICTSESFTEKMKKEVEAEALHFKFKRRPNLTESVAQRNTRIASWRNNLSGNAIVESESIESNDLPRSSIQPSKFVRKQ